MIDKLLDERSRAISFTSYRAVSQVPVAPTSFLPTQLENMGTVWRVAVILGFMADTKHVVLIHGSWSRGDQLAAARTAFEERGYTAHTPTLRHHELPLHEGALKIASLSLRDYTDDLVAFVNSLERPPLLIGHSVGGLLAQLVAVRTHHAGLVAACPAPAAGIFGTTPTNLRMSVPWFLRPRPWARPVRPPRPEKFRRWVTNTQTEDSAREIYDGLVCESGRVNWEILLAAIKISRATVVDFAAVTSPVLVMGGECDRIVPAGVVRRTAARYQYGTYVEIPGMTTWCFQGRRCLSPWDSLTTGLLGITCSPVPSCSI
jgi:pimeloyl-ACP methyl ester carboxylesterase